MNVEQNNNKAMLSQGNRAVPSFPERPYKTTFRQAFKIYTLF